MSVPTTTVSPNPWLRILDALEKKINRHSYDTWLKALARCSAECRPARRPAPVPIRSPEIKESRAR